jgi:hypothetical protein
VARQGATATAGRFLRQSGLTCITSQAKKPGEKLAPPRTARIGWAQRWEQRSEQRGKPSQIIGWNAGDTGSLLTPPEYMKLAGPWTGGKNPARVEFIIHS